MSAFKKISIYLLFHFSMDLFFMESKLKESYSVVSSSFPYIVVL